jgi:Mitochondrial ribosomal protein (VAR1)
MLNILKSKLKNKYKKKSVNRDNITIYYKDFVPAIRDWKSSIYTYNKYFLTLIPVANRFVIKLIKSYFNSYNCKLESKIRKEKLRRRYRKLSTNKIFISNGEFKHTNDKLSITIYFFNRQKYNYLLKINKRYTRLFNKIRFLRKLYMIKYIGLNILNQQRDKFKLLENLLPRYKSKLHSIQSLYYKRFIKKSLLRLKYYMFYKQLLYINKSKFDNYYLQGLINLIKKIYKKNIEFNLINLKYFYFNSDIFSQSLVLKLRKKRKLLRYLKACVRKAKIKNIKLSEKSRYFFDSNKFNILYNNDIINNILYKLMIKNKNYSNDIKKVVLNYIKYKRVSGVRIEASGRLTKRYTASRSQHKVRYLGNLENTYSSIKGYPSVVLRGNFKPNLQYTKLYSKSRIGSFGIKGWVSGI